MYLRLLLAATVLFTSSSLLQAQEFNVKAMRISEPFARATVPQQQSAGAYLTLENRGQRADRLVAASTPVAKSVELHTMAIDGTVMRMREVDAIEIKPSEKVVMKPGEGYHLMLLGLRGALKAGDVFPLSLLFEKSGAVEITVKVVDMRSASGNAHRGH
jgi:periplasmic copper chaperone A